MGDDGKLLANESTKNFFQTVQKKELNNIIKNEAAVSENMLNVDDNIEPDDNNKSEVEAPE